LARDTASVIVIGAGPSGLATSRELARRGVDHFVLERGHEIAHVWANLYDGLVLHTGKHFSALPGMSFPPSTPLFPTRLDFVDYLSRYAEAFHLPVRTSVDVVHAERDREEWVVRAADGRELRSRFLVAATGIVSNPRMPAIPIDARARVIHSVSYRRPDEFAGRRVLVIGAGNSAAEISVELARAGADVTIAVRSGARVVPRQLLGIPIQYFAVALAVFPPAARRVAEALVTAVSTRLRGPAVLPPKDWSECSNVPLIGFQLIDAIRLHTVRLKRGVGELTARGARFEDGSEEPFDQVILATGYQAAVGLFGDLVRLDPCGFAMRRDRVISIDQPDLYFVGHNYDTRGGLRNIAADSRRTAGAIARQLA
jgi:cation diffusion facilitator CzcD-associated flavoprotein CzcO